MRTEIKSTEQSCKQLFIISYPSNMMNFLCSPFIIPFFFFLPAYIYLAFLSIKFLLLSFFFLPFFFNIFLSSFILSVPSPPSHFFILLTSSPARFELSSFAGKQQQKFSRTPKAPEATKEKKVIIPSCRGRKENFANFLNKKNQEGC